MVITRLTGMLSDFHNLILLFVWSLQEVHNW